MFPVGKGHSFECFLITWWRAERYWVLPQAIRNALWNANQRHYVSQPRGETDAENVLILGTSGDTNIPKHHVAPHLLPAMFIGVIFEQQINVELVYCQTVPKIFGLLMQWWQTMVLSFCLVGRVFVQRKALVEVWYVNQWEWRCWQWQGLPLPVPHTPPTPLAPGNPEVSPGNPIFEKH